MDEQHGISFVSMRESSLWRFFLRLNSFGVYAEMNVHVKTANNFGWTVKCAQYLYGNVNVFLMKS